MEEQDFRYVSKDISGRQSNICVWLRDEESQDEIGVPWNEVDALINYLFTLKKLNDEYPTRRSD